MNCNNLLLSVAIILSSQVQAQDEIGLLINWHLKGNKSEILGTNVQSLYESNQIKAGEKIIVAVMDSGFDINHEDLKNKFWINTDEIPNNGEDDDNNGYIDDIHGWNFIGGSDGNQVQYDNFEITRLYRDDLNFFKNLIDSQKEKLHPKRFAQFQERKKIIEEKKTWAQRNFEEISQSEIIITDAIDALEEVLPPARITIETINELEPKDDVKLLIAQNIFTQVLDDYGDEMKYVEIKELIKGQIKDQKEYFETRYKYNFNPDYDPRSLVGDNYEDPSERGYGNSDIIGPDPDHGTQVSGIIAATRGNNIGIEGIANNVQIMGIRVVPDGDERDKDIANGIYYAVDNGARIINMSFGKGDSPYKDQVDQAVRYAAKKGVLIVHASGNDSKEINDHNNFPNNKYLKKKFLSSKIAKNWLEVGASSFERNKHLLASFSNYGKNKVNVLAPGVSIYSTSPGNSYEFVDGTSFSAPVVAGIGALIWSQFPDLKLKEMVSILKSGYSPYNEKVIVPGTKDQLSYLNKITETNGIINAQLVYNKAKELSKKS